MKVYISADIEGITGVTNWDETTLNLPDHKAAAEQMTRETAAACEAALEMGATEIYVKDAHDSARNLDPLKLPRGVKLIRGWMNCPGDMLGGLDSTFDAAVFIGYHSEGGSNGNPLAHTTSSSVISQVKLNGKRASEFTLNAYFAAYYGVPVVFLSGDQKICESASALIGKIPTAAVKQGVGNATVNLDPLEACEKIKEGVKAGLANPSDCFLKIPDHLDLEIRFHDHHMANRAAYYPGASRLDEHTVSFQAANMPDLMIAYMFMG